MPGQQSHSAEYPPKTPTAPSTLDSLPKNSRKYLTPDEQRRMSNPLQTITEHSELQYDRMVNIRAWGGRESDPEREFVRALPPVIVNRLKPQPESMIFFKMLTPSIRRRIYSYVFELPADGQKVTLSIPAATKDVFPPDFFIIPWDLLHHVEGALSSGRQMRDELLTYFWSTYHFHVTFSPFTTGPVFSGLSIKWLNLYAERINHLTVEVDMTKLEFSACKDAKLLSQSYDKVHTLIIDLVEAICRRTGRNVMAHLTLLIRRYFGFRPAPADNPEDKYVPYCPEEAQSIFNPFRELKWIVLQCSMCGFSVNFCREFMNGIIHKPMTKKRAIIVNPWPDYTPPPPVLTYHSSFNTASSVETPSLGHGQKTPSLGSSFGYSQDTPSGGSSSSGFGYAQNTPSVGSANTGAGYVQTAPGSGHFTPTGSFVSSASTPLGTIMTPKAGSSIVDEAGEAIHSAGGSIGLGILLNLPQASASIETADTEASCRHATPPQSDGLPNAPKSPNTMNALNDLDPAFNRAVEGLRMASKDGKESLSSGKGKKKKHGKNKKKGRKH